MLQIVLQQLMSNQPIIIEQTHQKSNLKKSLDSKDSQKFYELLDEVQNYDMLAIKIRKEYEQAMLLLASVKFNNPFALTSNSHRCIPAFLTTNQEYKFESGYVPFTQTIDQDQFPEQFEQQEEIQKQCKEMNKKLFESDKQSSKTIRQNESLFRFNVLNQQTEVVSAAKKFQELLTSLLRLIETKSSLEKTFNQIQNQKDKK